MKNPLTEALLWLLKNAHFTGNHPEAAAHIDAVVAFTDGHPELDIKITPDPEAASQPAD